MVAVCLLALTLRVVVIIHMGDRGLAFSNDALAYHEIAINLIKHHRFANTADPPHNPEIPQVNRSPLLPFLLAATYAVGGARLWAGQLVLALAGSLGSAVVYLLGWRLFGSAVGLVAGLLAATYPFFLLLTITPLTESLAILLYPALALLLVTIARTGTTRHGIGLGLALGLATLTKPTMLGFLPLLAVWLGFHFREQVVLGVKVFLVSLTVMALVLLPWALRNWSAFGKFSPANLVSWQTVYMGTSPYADYSLRLLETGAAWGWRYHPEWAKGFGNLQSPVAAEFRARALAIEFVRNNPQQFIWLALRKERIFWTAYPDAVHRLSWYPVATLSALGALWTVRQWRELMPLYLLIGHTALIPIFFTSLPRFRAPVEPLLMVFAAYAIVRMGQAFKHRPFGANSN